jgi:hypothetical protein
MSKVKTTRILERDENGRVEFARVGRPQFEDGAHEELPILDVEGRSGVYEDQALSASPIACAVADAYASGDIHVRTDAVTVRTVPANAALDALETATRESPLRKVWP